jgi:hypothetical protein
VALEHDPREPAVPDWRIADQYRALLVTDRRAFAWEWLRRNAHYQQSWSTTHNNDRCSLAPKFGLVKLEDPALPSAHARPVWRADIDTGVVVAEILPVAPLPEEGIDFLAIASFVTLAVDPDDHEHLLLSDGIASVRLDIVNGTLLGGRMRLSYRLSGIAQLREPLMALRRLVALVLTGRFSRTLLNSERMAARWVIELRVADAIADGASHQEIARTLFGGLIKDGRWRSEGDAVRLRAQRLARKAGKRLRDGAHLQWFKSK